MPEEKSISLLIFDYDETLALGGRPTYYDCMEAAVTKEGVRIPRQVIERRMNGVWGANYVGQVEAVLGESPSKTRRAKKVGEFYLACLQTNYLANVTPVTGSVEMLEELEQRGYDLALATAAEPTVLPAVLRKSGIDKSMFKKIVTASDIPLSKRKPDPYQLQLIMESRNKRPDETLYIGDHENDVLMAQAAGVRIVVTRTGHLDRIRAEELGVSPLDLIRDVTFLPAVLGRLSLEKVNAH